MMRVGPGALLCSRNARPQKALVGRAQLESDLGPLAWAKNESKIGLVREQMRASLEGVFVGGAD